MSQVLRLGGNLVLTRLLVPDFFGLMAITNVFMLGLGLFSDIGLGPGVIRSERSADPIFLNTAWTIQFIRGTLLALLGVVIAVPVANIYEMPVLRWMIVVCSFSFLFSSLSSTAIFVHYKKIKLGKIIGMEIGAQFIALLCMVSLAFIYRNVWALIAGSVLSATIKTIWSFFLGDNIRHKFVLEKEAVSELLSFGKWVFVSTAMMFLATQADRVLLGKFFTITLFGVYNIAVIFAELPKQVINRLSNSVIFPVMSNFSDLPRHLFRKKISEKRKMILLPMALLIAILASFGDVIVYVLYDERYFQAGWMLPLLALGMWPFVLCASIDRCFFAIGKPKISAVCNFAKFIYMVTCVPLLFSYAGVLGGVVAVAANDLPSYLVMSVGLKREKLSCFQQDVTSTVALVGLVIFFVTLRLAFDMGLPGQSALVDGR